MAGTADYILPQVLVFQDFQRTVAAVEQPLKAFYAGGNSSLIRFSDSDEKPNGLLGAYDKVSDAFYSWPDRPAGGIVDESYTKLYADNLVLRYFSDLIGQGGGYYLLGGLVVFSTSGTAFKTGNGTDRDERLGDRDVQAGDWVYVRAVVGADVYEIETEVSSVSAANEDSSVAAATLDENNPSTQSLVTTPSVTKTAGVDNCMTLAASAASYDGLTDGGINETYTVRVVQSSVGGDLTTGKVRLISSSGDDDVLSVSPSDDGDEFTIGARGLLLTFDRNVGSCSLDAAEDGAPASDIVAGQEWQFTVQSAYTAPTVASNGGANYAGTKDTTYIVTVTRGGLFAASAKPQITCTTTNGVDISGPTLVSAVSSAVAVGTKGVTITFTGVSGLRKGDQFLIPVTAAAPGKYNLLTLRESFAPGLIPEMTEVDIKLGIRRSGVEITKNRIGDAPNVNWSTTTTQLKVEAGITMYDSSWTVDGVQELLPVEKATLYVETRYWLSDLTDGYHEIYDPGQLSAVPGPIHPDNPLKYALFLGLQNNNGVPIGYMATNDPTNDDDWVRVLEVIEEKRVVEPRFIVWV
jgi:hypothetical protein